MVHQWRTNFPHRFNADHTYDSICTICHMTVARERNEAELAQHEQSHSCSPLRLYQLSEYPLWPNQPLSRNSQHGPALV